MPIEQSPVPTEWGVGHIIASNGSKWYLLQFTTPVGIATYWFDGEALDALITGLRSERGGVVVPPSSEVRRFARELRDSKRPDSHGG